MAPKTKPRTTKKPTATSQRKPRTAVEARIKIDKEREDLPAAIGRSVASALGRTLSDLLDGREVTSAGVHAWAVEKEADQYVATHINLTPPKQTISPVEGAINYLRAAVTHAEVITDNETERLDCVLSPSPVRPAGDEQATGGPPSLAQTIHSLAERIYADNMRRANMLDRLEL